jgi:hypothetical protein
MPIDTPPVPKIERTQSSRPETDPPIVDMREHFARKTPQSAEDEERTRAFIDGRIEMIRRDPHMSPAEKSQAIRELEAKR